MSLEPCFSNAYAQVFMRHGVGEIRQFWRMAMAIRWKPDIPRLGPNWSVTVTKLQVFNFVSIQSISTFTDVIFLHFLFHGFLSILLFLILFYDMGMIFKAVKNVGNSTTWTVSFYSYRFVSIASWSFAWTSNSSRP